VEFEASFQPEIEVPLWRTEWCIPAWGTCSVVYEAPVRGCWGPNIDDVLLPWSRLPLRACFKTDEILHV
jgi:hypothetical protein